jgi:transposase
MAGRQSAIGWSMRYRMGIGTPHPRLRGGRLFIAGLRQDGLVAPCVFDGAINGEAFLAYVEQVLAPTLASGDIVVMDNLGSHKVAGVRQAIEARGAKLLYLPPYSPDLNPFAKLCCAPRHRKPSSNSGARSVILSYASRLPNAPTSSAMQDISSHPENALEP